MRDHPIDILMYHSISDANGPTSIAPEIFADQMQALADSGLPVVSMDAVVAARKGEAALPGRAVAITFDDGFQDFADAAWPILSKHRFPAMVYIPTRHVGAHEGWRGSAFPARALMGWPTIRDLSGEGVDFGSHTETHPDLEALSPVLLDSELRDSRKTLEDHLGKDIRHFAPPYGRAGPKVRRRIESYYDSSVSTELRQARRRDGLHNLPRLEMFYYKAAVPWRAHLAGWGSSYLGARNTLRRVREAVQDPWEKQGE